MHAAIKSKFMSAEEVAELIQDGEVIGASGFTPAGYPKAIPKALAKRGMALHAEGKPFSISLYTGASTGDELDGELARANILERRIPYQSNADLRKSINNGTVKFTDFHLSHVTQYVRYGFVPKPTTAIIEAVDVTPEGRVYLSMSGGASASYMLMADRIFIELNTYYGEGLKGFHDVYLPPPPPSRPPIPLYTPLDRIGTPYVEVPWDKIAGIVVTDQPDKSAPFRAPDAVSQAIAGHIVEFIKHERKMGRLPENLPFQSGVGNVANAVLGVMAHDPSIQSVSMYTEVIQDSIFDIIDAGKLRVASTSALTLSSAGQKRFLEHLDSYRSRFVLRQQEISNHPEIVRRLGIVAMNTALEFDIFGNVNSTHVMGSSMMNGIGGSADFSRNSYLPIFMTPSTAKDGKISSVVPMVTHVDHNEHSTQIFVTEQGIADVRGLSPVARARVIIENCAHPDYKPILSDYLEYGLKHAPSKHTPHVLSKAFQLHQKFLDTGSMQ
jgi:succinyl-CoA:acetate CoA-transferase